MFANHAIEFLRVQTYGKHAQYVILFLGYPVHNTYEG
jgi:hypothetical protein